MRISGPKNVPAVQREMYDRLEVFVSSWVRESTGTDALLGRSAGTVIHELGLLNDLLNGSRTASEDPCRVPRVEVLVAPSLPRLARASAARAQVCAVGGQHDAQAGGSGREGRLRRVGCESEVFAAVLRPSEVPHRQSCVEAVRAARGYEF